MTIQIVIQENAMGAFSIAEAKAQLSAIVQIVENGESVTITRRGNPVVKIVPVTAVPVKPKPDFEKLRAFRATLTPMKESAVEAIRRMRDGEIEE
jgi:prevent-host-death family protein